MHKVVVLGKLLECALFKLNRSHRLGPCASENKREREREKERDFDELKERWKCYSLTRMN